MKLPLNSFGLIQQEEPMLQMIEQEFSVRYTFPVLFSRTIFDEGNRLLAELLRKAGKKRHKVLVFIDSGVIYSGPQLGRQIERYAGMHHNIMDLVAPPVIIAGGEQCKNEAAVIDLIHACIEAHHLCRQSFVLAIGGGAVLDAVGYGAATAHRGVRLIRIPTTVLAQNDAGVGVKNGINGYGRKNFLGTFAPPYAVINDFSFLNTLSPRDLRAGIVEAVKVALIKDRIFFKTLYKERQHLAAFAREAMENMIFRCAALHIEHIGTQGDPFETGSARPLDFGHWSAHKLEELTGHTINHGEAVAVGIALDSHYACRKGLISKTELYRILTLLEDLHLTLFHPALGDMDIKEALTEFQEHLGGDLTITLPAGIGDRKEVHAIDAGLMYYCVGLLKERWLNRVEKGKKYVPASSSVRPTLKIDSSRTLSVCPVIPGMGSR
jgi:3-dehydroquinate synthase